MDKFNGLDPFKSILKEKKVTKKRMAEMWCELNVFVVPKEFKGELLPFDFNNTDRAFTAMKDIESIIGKEATLAEWNNPGASYRKINR